MSSEHTHYHILASDLILVIENGEIAEMGNHKELIELNGIYARMDRVQASVR